MNIRNRTIILGVRNELTGQRLKLESPAPDVRAAVSPAPAQAPGSKAQTPAAPMIEKKPPLPIDLKLYAARGKAALQVAWTDVAIAKGARLLRPAPESSGQTLFTGQNAAVDPSALARLRVRQRRQHLANPETAGRAIAGKPLVAPIVIGIPYSKPSMVRVTPNSSGGVDVTIYDKATGTKTYQRSFDAKEAGRLVILGGYGDDHIEVDPRVTHGIWIDGGAGNDVITGGSGNDRISGGTGNDTINGGEGNDELLGGDDNDRISGGHGDDTIRGGNGEDFIAGGTGKDAISGEQGNDEIWGGSEDDSISGGIGKDKIYGEGGSDKIAGDSGDDEINGGTGDDTILGGEGMDVIRGESGKDRIWGGEQNDQIYGGSGDDYIHGGGGDDFIYEESGKNQIFGADGKDVIYGGSQKDIIYGGDGDDSIYGLGGNDHIEGGQGEDGLFGGDGDDTLHGGSDNDLIAGEEGRDFIWGGAGDDMLLGGNGDDDIYGGDDNDRIWGGSGGDLVDGGRGLDTLHDGEALRDPGDVYDRVMNTEFPNVYGGGIPSKLRADTGSAWDASEEAAESAGEPEPDIFIGASLPQQEPGQEKWPVP